VDLLVIFSETKKGLLHFCRFKNDITRVLKTFVPFLLAHPVEKLILKFPKKMAIFLFNKPKNWHIVYKISSNIFCPAEMYPVFKNIFGIWPLKKKSGHHCCRYNNNEKAAH